MDHTSVKGLSVIVTGGSAGIGLATARMLTQQGAHVTTFDIAEAPHECAWRHIVVDLRDAKALHLATEEVFRHEGKLDVLVNNAGVSFEGGVETGDESEWDTLWDINVMGSVRATRSALPYLRDSKHAVIINVISCTTSLGIPNRAAYSATKGALHSMSLSMSADLIKENIRVSIVSPGTVDTPFMDELAKKYENPDAMRKQFHSRQPIGRMVRPEEVAGAIAYLASPLAAPTVGTVLTVDGGMGTIRNTP